MSDKSAAAKLIRNGTEIDADTARVQFSPVVRKSLARLEALVNDSPTFSPTLVENLHELASGAPYSVHTALTEMALIARETMKHVHATGDTRAKEALDDLIANVMGVERDGDTKPVTIIAPKTRTR